MRRLHFPLIERRPARDRDAGGPPDVRPWGPGSVPALCTLGLSAALVAFALSTGGSNRHWPEAHAGTLPARARVVAPVVPQPSSAELPVVAPELAPAPLATAATAAAGDSADESAGGDEIRALALLDTAEPGPLADTPLAENDAAEYLARAWYAVLGRRARETTVAVLWAHWAHETARGQRMHGHNFGGIKGRGPTGAGVLVWTREGPRLTDLVQRTFRAYETPREGAHDYVSLLRTRYPKAFRAARYGRVDEFVAALEEGRYFTADGGVYLRAVTRLSLECRRRGVSMAAVERVRQYPNARE